MVTGAEVNEWCTHGRVLVKKKKKKKEMTGQKQKVGGDLKTIKMNY